MPTSSQTGAVKNQFMAPSLSLELDELDDLILGSTGFGRGPPPEKFVCSVSGELIREVRRAFLRNKG